MTWAYDPKRGLSIDSYFGPEKDRLTVRGLLVIMAIVASTFAFASHLFRTAIPETDTTRWWSSDGFIEVGVGDEVFTYLLVSLLPKGEVVLTRRSYLAFGEHTRTTLTLGSEDIRLTRRPVIVVVDQNGEVHSGPCPLDRKEIQRLINGFPASRMAVRGCVSETLQFLRHYDDRDWPPEIQKLLIAR